MLQDLKQTHILSSRKLTSPPQINSDPLLAKLALSVRRSKAFRWRRKIHMELILAAGETDEYEALETCPKTKLTLGYWKTHLPHRKLAEMEASRYGGWLHSAGQLRSRPNARRLWSNQMHGIPVSPMEVQKFRGRHPKEGKMVSRNSLRC